MALTPITNQRDPGLYGFYRSLDRPGASGSLKAAAEQMLQLLPLVEALCSDIPVWGMSSHATLVLLAEDASDAPGFVRISPVGKHGYEISYLMPEHEAPWPYARVTGHAPDTQSAGEMIRVAMQKSGGWSLPGKSG